MGDNDIHYCVDSLYYPLTCFTCSRLAMMQKVDLKNASGILQSLTVKRVGHTIPAGKDTLPPHFEGINPGSEDLS